MKTISRYIMTLALLITAVGGAWAQTQWKSGDCTVTLNNGTLTVSGKGAMEDYMDTSNRPWENNKGDITSVVVESGVTSVGIFAFDSFSKLTSVTLPEGLTAIGPYAFQNCGKLTSISIPSTVTSIGGIAFGSCSSLASITLPEGLKTIDGMAFASCSSLTSITIPSTVTSIGVFAFMSCSAISDVNLYANPDNLTWNEASFDFKDSKATQCHVLAEHLSTYQTKFSSANVTFVGDLKPLPGTMVLNSDKTTATMTMPTSDVTIDYELVRDMSVQMTATMGDGTDGVRYRVKKAQQGQGYEPADMNMMQVLALVAVNDGIEHKDLTLDEDYTVLIYPVDENGQILSGAEDGVTFQNFTFAPGLYALKAFAQDDSDYAGETPLSNTFKLFQGYEVTVPAGEYATFYKDENLYTEDDDAELYTIASVTDTEAVLSDAIKVAPAETPLLVYNKSEESKTFLLIPTTDVADEVTPATQFVGTLEATTIPASATGADNYALNGYAFVWVKTAIEVGANKCWLHIASQPAAARAMTRSIVGGNGTTGIDAIENVTIDNEGWYDLQGRKLQAKPNRGGIYIHNGKKVIVR